jgi:hypothetical protein
MRLQIADAVLQIAVHESDGTPGMAVIRDGRVVVEPWQAGGTAQA